MTEKSNALALAQLLMLHADTIENDSIKNMVIDSATELAVLHDEIERLREVLNKLEYSFDGAIKRYPDEHEVEAALQEVPR